MHQLIERFGAHGEFQRQLFGFSGAGLPVRDFPLVLLNPPAVFLGADHAIAKKHNRCIHAPTSLSNCFLFLLFEVLIILIASIGLVHLDCQFGHEVQGLRADSKKSD